jgi:hypothetical protein
MVPDDIKKETVTLLPPQIPKSFATPRPKKAGLSAKVTSLGVRRIVQKSIKPPIKIAKIETSPPKVAPLKNGIKAIPALLNKVKKKSVGSIVQVDPLPKIPYLEKKGVLLKLDELFTARREVQPKKNDIIRGQLTKNNIAPKKYFSEMSMLRNSPLSATLPLPEPPPIAEIFSIAKNIKLVIGTKHRLGDKLNLESVKDKKCVKKTKDNILFCLERVSWPPEIGKNLRSPLSIMGDNMAMIRYDNSKASQIHLNFPTDVFDILVEYFEKKYGPPTEYPRNLMRRIGVPPKQNPTIQWRVANAEMNRDVILEIRKTDDLRSILPAEGTGMVRLYSNGDATIFRYISTVDIMLMRMKDSTTQ